MKGPIPPAERDKLRFLKRLHDLSTRDLAERTGIDRFRVERLLAGDRGVRPGEIDALRVALGLPQRDEA